MVKRSWVDVKEAYRIILTENARFHAWTKSALQNKIYNECLLLYVKLQSSKADWTSDIRPIKIVFRHNKFSLFRA